MSDTNWTPKRSHDNFNAEDRAKLDSYYWHRPMLKIKESKYTNGPQLSIMTYNLLHPCDRKRYPISGMTREQILLVEVVRYNPDIVCLQEVSTKFKWAEIFARYGYTMRILRPNKFHGNAIAYKSDLFLEHSSEEVKFWGNEDGLIDEKYPSFHGALLLCLNFKPEFLKGCNHPSREAIIIGCTHLPSTGARTFSRVRATAILFKSIERFTQYIRSKGDFSRQFYTFLAGDFNSTVDDAAYHTLVSKPVDFFGWSRDMLISSINCDQQNEEKFHLPKNVTKPPETMDKLYLLENFHNSIRKRAVSIYSIGYSLVHKANTQPGTNEPWFSLWCEHSHDLVDFIFAVSDWDGKPSKMVGSLDEYSKFSGTKLLALLGMPTHDDMGLVDRPQPVVGEFPSDHLCMMADLELL